VDLALRRLADAIGGSVPGVRRVCCTERERGNALVEFAIVVPLLLLLVFGIIEWGVFLNRKIDLTQGVRDAGRQAAVAAYSGGLSSCASGSPTAQLVCLAHSRIGVNGVAVHVIAPTTNTVGAQFAVCATYQTTSVTGLMAPVLPKFMRTETIMRLEQAPTNGLTTGGDADPEGNNWTSCSAPQ
jgi:Flp pilus assembly protein TadG